MPGCLCRPGSKGLSLPMHRGSSHPERFPSRACEFRFRLSRCISQLLLGRYIHCETRYGQIVPALLLPLSRLLPKLILPKPAGPIIVPTLLGFDMLVEPLIGKGVEESIYYSGIYEAGTISVLKQSLREGDVFIDVGANVGMMSLAASKFVGSRGQVYAFEPLAEALRILTTNLTINRVKNVLVVPEACGARQELRTIYEQQANRGCSSLLKPVDCVAEQKDIVVNRLDDFIEAEGIKKVKMVKIDVEGWELEVLKGSRRLLSQPQSPIICVEYSHSHRLYAGIQEDVYQFICSSNNYKIFKLARGKEFISCLEPVTGFADLPRHDNLFCFLPSHLEEIHRRDDRALRI